jgi:hypothetical protein
MFRCMERFWGTSDRPLSRDDFFDFDAVVEALQAAGRSSEETPLRHLAQVLAEAPNGPERITVDGLGNLMMHYPFQRNPLFAALKLEDPDAEALLQSSRAGGHALDAGDQLWLNRRLLEAAFRQTTGRACFRRLNGGLDGVLVSDVGKPFQVQSNQRAGGLIRTALRSTDILMDRVWQLEKETFEDTPGFVFAPVTEVVDPHEDPTAPHPEIQRQAAHIRTDLDRFSDLEISSLVRHGYCVGRKACRSRPDLFGGPFPADDPWDPVPSAPRAVVAPGPTSKSQSGPARAPVAATVQARTLQASAQRRIWSTLLNYRDWTSYIYVPLLVPILVLTPYFTYKAYQRSQRINQLVESIIQNSRDYQEMSRLLDDGPVPPWTGVPAEEVAHFDEPDYKGFLILQDTQIIDLRRLYSERSWQGASNPWMYGYRRLRVVKQPENTGNPLLHIQLLPSNSHVDARFPAQQLQPTLRMAKTETPTIGQEQYLWEMTCDFQKVPAGVSVDVLVEYSAHDAFQKEIETGHVLSFVVQAQTAEKGLWLLMPEGKEYRSWDLIRYEAGKPEAVEAVQPVTEYLAQDYTILAFKLLALKPGFTYEVRWTYKD